MAVNRRGPARPAPKPYSPTRGEFAGVTFRSEHEYRQFRKLGWVPQPTTLFRPRSHWSRDHYQPGRVYLRYTFTDDSGEKFGLLVHSSHPLTTREQQEVVGREIGFQGRAHETVCDVEQIYAHYVEGNCS